jgi:NADH dehydrogenase (ubiquinone) 1 alpha subcomplex subunit 12
VVYNPKYNVDYDGSMVPAEWYGWLHYKTDKTPIEKVCYENNDEKLGSFCS